MLSARGQSQGSEQYQEGTRTDAYTCVTVGFSSGRRVNRSLVPQTGLPRGFSILGG